MIAELTGVLERDTLTKEALHHAKLKRVVIISGKIGSGKTTILEHIAVKLADLYKIPPIYIKHTTPYKQFILDIVYQLHRRELLDEKQQIQEWETLYKELNRAHSRQTLSIIYATFKVHPNIVICVDNIHEATQHGLTLFRHLLDQEHPPRLICTANGLSKLKYLVWQAELLNLPPLSKKATHVAVDAFIETEGLRVDSPKTFKQQIYNISSGNPLAIANKLRYCRYEPKIKKHLLSKHHRSSGRNELDMSFTIIILFVVAMMNRYIARAVGDTHLYMLSSIIAALTIGGRFVLSKASGKEEV